MSIEQLTIGEKVANQGATPAGKLTAVEFNELVDRVKDLIDNANDNEENKVTVRYEDETLFFDNI